MSIALRTVVTAATGDVYDIRFRSDDHLALHDSYPQEVFKAVTDEQFPEKFKEKLINSVFP